MRAVADTPASLVEELAGARNVLLLGPSLDAGDDDGCGSLLSAVPAEDANVLSVTFKQSPDTRVERWQSGGGPVEPANLGFLVVGEGIRSASAAQSTNGGPGIDGARPTVASVTNPSDLTGLGIELGNFFEEWADDGNDLLLCFHTLTMFLQFADLQSVYKFIHVLTGRVRSVEGLAHFHLDPTAHDEQTVNTLLALFDAVVEKDDSGNWDLTRRR